MSVVIKHMSQIGSSTFSMIVMRNIFAVVMMLPFIFFKRRTMQVMLRNKRMFFWRTILGFTGMLLMFQSVILLPVNSFVALSFTIPIFATIGAVLFLGEKMGWHRWGAVALGFIGMLIIVQPTNIEIGAGVWICMVFCIMTAGILLIVKKMSATEHVFSMMFYLHLWMGYLSIPLFFISYHELNLQTMKWGVVLALTSITAHYSLVKSYSLVPLTVTSPFEFSRILMASLLAYIFLGEVPETESYVGAAIIIASVAYIAHRESRRKMED
jgi:drug/metabolite transporter (DMT)-like permease